MVEPKLGISGEEVLSTTYSWLCDVWTVAGKEIRHCSRDGHVLIYSVVIPIVLYPLIVMGGSELALWKQGWSEKKPLRIALAASSRDKLSELEKEIARSKKTTIVESSDPLSDLKKQKLECYVEVKPDMSGMIAHVNPASDRYVDTKYNIRTLAAQAREQAARSELDRKGLSDKFMRVFTIESETLDSVKGKHGSKDREGAIFGATLISAIITVYTMLIVQTGAIYPALTTFTEEIEKKTKSTTVLLPVTRSTIVYGKFICVLMFALVSGLINLASLVIVVAYLFHRLPVRDYFTSDLPLQSIVATMLAGAVYVAAIYLVIVTLITSVYCLVASAAKSFREGQNLASFVLLTSMLAPMLTMVPGWKLDLWTAWVPLLNIALLTKSIMLKSFSTGMFFMTITESLVLSWLALHMCKLAFWGREPTAVAPSASIDTTSN